MKEFFREEVSKTTVRVLKWGFWENLVGNRENAPLIGVYMSYLKLYITIKCEQMFAFCHKKWQKGVAKIEKQ